MRKQVDALLTAVVVIGSLLVVGILMAIIAQVVVSGLPEVSWEFLTTEAAAGGKAGGIFNSIIATLLVTLIGILIAAPLGVGSAVYLEEYSTSSRLNEIITMAAETMAGIPSIVYGLFGLVFFVIMLGWGWSILAGGCTLALMALPLIIRTSQEAIRAVPHEYRENSMALGASREQTLLRLILPAASPGILGGIVLSVGRIAGETAAVLLTAGSALGIPRSLFDTGRPLPVHLYILASEGISMSKAYGTALVLIGLVLIFNFCVYRLRKSLS